MAQSNTETNEPRYLTITTVDKQTISVNADITKLSVTISNIQEDLPDDSSSIPLLIEQATEDNVRKVIEFLSYINDNKPEAHALQVCIHRKELNGLPVWFIQFLSIPSQQLYDLLILADYLHIQILIDYISMHIANIIRNSSIIEINKMFS